MRPATQDEQARSTELGLRLVDQIDGFVATEAKKLGVTISSPGRSQELGRWLVLCVLAAGNEVSWIDTAHLVVGIGHALGEVAGQNPHAAAQILTELEEGMKAGERKTVAALKPQGSA